MSPLANAEFLNYSHGHAPPLGRRGAGRLTAGMTSEIVPHKTLKALRYRANDPGSYLDFSIGARDSEAARALTAFLTTRAAKATLEAQGMEAR